MKQLLEQIKAHLEKNDDYDGEIGSFGFVTYSANKEGQLLRTIEFCEGDDEEWMWSEILDYCQKEGKTEWAHQIENYFVNTSIG